MRRAAQASRRTQERTFILSRPSRARFSPGHSLAPFPNRSLAPMRRRPRGHCRGPRLQAVHALPGRWHAGHPGRRPDRQDGGKGPRVLSADWRPARSRSRWTRSAPASCISRCPQTHRVRDWTSRRGPCSIALRPTRTSSGVLWRSSACAGVTGSRTPEEAEFVFIVESGYVPMSIGDSGAPGPRQRGPDDPRADLSRSRRLGSAQRKRDWWHGFARADAAPAKPDRDRGRRRRPARQLAAVDPRRGRSGGGLPAASRRRGRARGRARLERPRHAASRTRRRSARDGRGVSGGARPAVRRQVPGPACLPAHLCGDHRCASAPSATRWTSRRQRGSPMRRWPSHPVVRAPAGDARASHRGSRHPSNDRLDGGDRRIRVTGAVRRLHGPGACRLSRRHRPSRQPGRPFGIAWAPMEHRVDRREFLAGVAGAAIILPRSAPAIRFAVIGINHPHINGMTAASSAAAASWCRCTRRSRTSPRPSPSGSRRPSSRAASSEILEDKTIQLVLSARFPTSARRSASA